MNAASRNTVVLVNGLIKTRGLREVMLALSEILCEASEQWPATTHGDVLRADSVTLTRMAMWYAKTEGIEE